MHRTDRQELGDAHKRWILTHSSPALVKGVSWQCKIVR